MISYYESQLFGLITRPSKLAITEDGAKTFSVTELKFAIRQDEPLQFHAANESSVLALEGKSLQKKV